MNDIIMKTFIIILNYSTVVKNDNSDFCGGVITMKRILGSTFIAIVFILLILGIYRNYQYKGQRINEVTNVRYSKITKIVFSDGRGGLNKPFILDNRQKIKEFMSLIDSYVVKKEKVHENSTGWTHMADFYDGDKKLMRITFTNPLEIDGAYYDIVKGQLSSEKIDAFIKSANSAWNRP